MVPVAVRDFQRCKRVRSIGPKHTPTGAMTAKNPNGRELGLGLEFFGVHDFAAVSLMAPFTLSALHMFTIPATCSLFVVGNPLQRTTVTGSRNRGECVRLCSTTPEQFHPLRLPSPPRG